MGILIKIILITFFLTACSQKMKEEYNNHNLPKEVLLVDKSFNLNNHTDEESDLYFNLTFSDDIKKINLYNDNNCSNLLDEYSYYSGISNTIISTSLSNQGLYSFYIKYEDSYERISDCVNLSFNYNYYKHEDNVLVMNNPSVGSISNNDNPDFSINSSDVEDGYLLKVFTDSNCSTEVGRNSFLSGNANITSSSLSNGNNSFYYMISNSDESENGSCIFSGNYYYLDKTTPVITGLSNDDISKKEKGFSWNCNRDSCNYRYVIDQFNYTNPTGIYSSGEEYTYNLGGTGTYYFHIQAIDSLGNESSVYHYSFEIDNTSPNPPVATIEFASPINNNNSNSISISWGASSSTDVISYEINLLSNPSDELTSLTGWIPVGNILSTSLNSPSSLSMAECTKYYFIVRAKDSSGNYSTNTQSSNTYYYDITEPDTPRSSYLIGNNSSKYYANSFEVDGANDNCGYGLKYKISIGTTPGGDEVVTSRNIRTGTNYQPRDGVENFSFALEPKVNYYINIKSIDEAGNESITETILGPWNIPLEVWSSGWINYDWTGDDTLLNSLIPDYTLLGIQFGNNNYPIYINRVFFHNSHPDINDDTTGDLEKSVGSNYYMTTTTTNSFYSGEDSVASPGGVYSNNLATGYAYTDFDINLIGLKSNTNYYIYLPHYGCVGEKATYDPDDGGSSLTYTNTNGSQKILRYGFTSSSSGTFVMQKTNALFNDLCLHGFWVVEAN